ncbi:MAG TPA: tetratricopeptide repeat protein [Terriglobia bacterium]|nr:tetratricopeptide repeat protein [Terriglobia bacterium]
MAEETRQDRAIRLFQEAYEHQMKKELDEAAELYKKSIETYPTAEAHTFLGWTYSWMGRIDDAIAECLKAIEVDPTFGNPYNDIGSYLLMKGQVDEAIPWLERALKAPRYENYCYPHMNLGRAYESKHDWLRAKDEYRKALAEKEDYTPAAQALARIRGFLN